MTIKKNNLLRAASDLVSKDSAVKRDARLLKIKQDKKLSQKERWKELYHLTWKSEHNTKRRIRYQEDELYREQYKATNRLYYRKKKSETTNVVSKDSVDCRVGLVDRFNSLGEFKKVYLSKNKFESKLVFNKVQAAEVLCITSVTLWKYIKANLIPAPIYEFAVMNNGVIYRKAKQRVYTSEELYVIADILGDHLTKCHKFTRSDKDVQFKMISRVGNVRSLLEK